MKVTARAKETEEKTGAEMLATQATNQQQFSMVILANICLLSSYCIFFLSN